jgi:hypothetical protein
MAYKLEKGLSSKKAFYSNNLSTDLTNLQTNDDVSSETENTDKNYVNVIKKVKKENITPENIDEIMLCQIPGISSVTALAIIKKFNTTVLFAFYHLKHALFWRH